MPGALTTHDHIYISIDTPAGKDALILTELSGVERMSQDFQFRLNMYALTPNLDVSKILGREATVTLKFKDHTRYINGILVEVVQGPTLGHTKEGAKNGQITYFTAVLCSQFGIARFNRNCRIFQNETVIDISKKLLSEQSVTAIEDKTKNSQHEKREYCVQYNESVFNFINRLWEAEGIFYFFKHSKREHKLIFADQNNAYEALETGETVHYSRGKLTQNPYMKVFECHISKTTVPKAYSASDFNEQTPKAHLKSNTQGQGLGGEIFEYPGNYLSQGQGDAVTKLRLESLESLQIILRGSSTVPFFAPGYKFKLAGHERSDVNVSYALLEVVHKARYDDETEQFLYENTFEAIPLNTPYHPPLRTPCPKIYGSQTAIVTGKSGEEIWTDKYSRIKVKFHWDRKDGSDEESSCWIRVTSLWAGSQWGILFTPRIGQEVVVSYLNGDPDRPIVTGSVYNGDNLPPYRPDDPTKSTLKSNSSKGGEGSNEIRFEDKKDNEEIYVHAQKDMNIDIIHNRKTTLEKGDCTTVLKEGNRSITLEKGDETHKIMGAYKADIEKDYTLKIGGNLTIEVGGMIQIKAGQSIMQRAGMGLSFAAGTQASVTAGGNLQLTAGASLNAEAGAIMSLKASAMGEYTAGGLLSLKGAMLKLN